MKATTLFLALLVFVVLISCSMEHMEFDFVSYHQSKDLKDGEYIGEVNQGLDRAKVKVVVLQGKIAEVEILNVLAFGWRDESVKNKLPSQFVDKQGVDIDAVTGASGSTHAVKIAVSRALEQSMD